MTTLKTIFAAIIISGISLPLISEAADTTKLKNQEHNQKCAVETTIRTDAKTLVQVYDEVGNLTYQTTVDFHTTAIDEQLPEGSLYLFTHEHVAYYIQDKNNRATAINLKK